MLRKHAFALALTVAVFVILGSCFTAWRAFSDLPTASSRLDAAQDQLYRLNALRSQVMLATSRARTLLQGGGEEDRNDLAEVIARGAQSIDDLRATQSLGGKETAAWNAVLGRAEECLSAYRAANSRAEPLTQEEFRTFRGRAGEVRQQIDSLSQTQRDQIQQLEADLADERKDAIFSLLGGHALMLAVLASLYVARRTERRLRQTADQNMQVADQRFAMVVRGSTDGMIVTDETGRIEVTNPAMGNILGADEQQLTGHRITRYFKTTLIDEWLDNRLDADVVDSPPTPLPVRRVQGKRADGERFLAELSVTPRNILDREILVISVRDVSEREAARVQLLQREALLDEILEPLHILDADGRIVYWNRGAAQLYGYSPDEAIGQTANDLLRIVPPKSEPANIYASDYLEAERWSGELLATSKAGKTLRIERRRTRFRHSDQPIGEVVLDLDLGERTRLQQVERRRQRLESLGTLSSGIAHDLNNLLTPILMSSKMLQRDSPHVDRAALVETIASGATRGADLIAQLLTFARGGDGQHQPIRLDTILPDIVSILRRTLPPGVQLTLDLEPELPEVSGDETEIGQVVMNLGINARDSMTAEGKLEIRVQRLTLTKPRSYSTTTLPPGLYVAISVGDTGTGIPSNIRDRIFDPFFSTKERGQGTGLGLSTTIGIVKSHHGAIGISSAVGKGTTVSVILPVCPSYDS